MPKTIWKFPLQDNPKNRIEMPKGTQILTAKMQHGIIALWGIVEPDAPKETRTFNIYGTGHILPDHASAGDWIATVEASPFIWHVFEFTK